MTTFISMQECITILKKNNIPTIEMPWGFKIEHDELRKANRAFAECDMDHEALIDISFYIEDGATTVDFCRFDYGEMASFLVESYKKAGESASRKDIVKVMKEVDSNYDYKMLSQRSREWHLNHMLKYKRNGCDTWELIKGRLDQDYELMLELEEEENPTPETLQHIKSLKALVDCDNKFMMRLKENGDPDWKILERSIIPLRKRISEAYRNKEGSMKKLADRFSVSVHFVRTSIRRYRKKPN